MNSIEQRHADGRNADGSLMDYRQDRNDYANEQEDKRLLRRRLELKIESLSIMHRFLEATIETRLCTRITSHTGGMRQ